jgi:hypothetical protein
MIAARTSSKPRARNPALPAREGRSWIRADSLRRRGPRLLVKQVVFERSREDRWIDQTGGVLERARAGGIDHGLAPATRSDDSGGRLVVAAVQIGAGPGQARVPLVEPGLVAAASVSTTAVSPAAASPQRSSTVPTR